jgi:peptide/nickel transport system permease protein
MLAYLLRRSVLMIPTVLGVLLLTFMLFAVAAPDPARLYAGRDATPETMAAVRAKMGLDKPRFFNPAATTRPVVLDAKTGQSREKSAVERAGSFFDSQFFDLMLFRFPNSMRFERPVVDVLVEKARVSVAIQLPAFLIALGLQLALALLVASKRASILDYTVTAVCVASLALPSLAAYIIFQWLLGAQLPLFPVSGWDTGIYAVQYAALPILCSVLLALGGGIRFYRTVILEEINQDYVRTARAKGVGPRDVLLVHVLRNVMIPLVTNTVTALPMLIFGALILERLFQIPGLGGLLVDSIFRQDRSVVMAITYLTALLYCIALLLTDVLYTLVDPRVTLK